MKKLNKKYLARLWVGDKANHPVYIVSGDTPPEKNGHESYFTTPSGKTVVRYPSAYKWPTKYHPSTMDITVGRGWLHRHRGAKYHQTADGSISVVLPKKYQQTIHGMHCVPGWCNKEPIWIVKTSDGYEYHHSRGTYNLSRRSAHKAAIAATAARKWRKKIAIANEKVIAAASSVWVGRNDSIKAGNCPLKTDSFHQTLKNIFGDIGGIRGDVLLGIRDDIFTRRAVKFAAQR